MVALCYSLQFRSALILLQKMMSEPTETRFESFALLLTSWSCLIWAQHYQHSHACIGHIATMLIIHTICIPRYFIHYSISSPHPTSCLLVLFYSFVVLNTVSSIISYFQYIYFLHISLLMCILYTLYKPLLHWPNRYNYLCACYFQHIVLHCTTTEMNECKARIKIGSQNVIFSWC